MRARAARLNFQGRLPWKPAVILLLILLAADVAYVAMHLRYPNARLFSLSAERSYSEVFQYMKEYWITGLLLLLAVRRQETVFVVWAALFGYLLVDDSRGLHERLGQALAGDDPLARVLGVRAQDIGELLVSGAAAAVFFAAIALAHRRASAGGRAESWCLVRLCIALAAFGIGVDIVHELLPPGGSYSLIAILEDGGEMVVMTFILAFAFAVVTETEPPTRARANVLLRYH